MHEHVNTLHCTHTCIMMGIIPVRDFGNLHVLFGPVFIQINPQSDDSAKSYAENPNL